MAEIHGAAKVRNGGRVVLQHASSVAVAAAEVDDSSGKALVGGEAVQASSLGSISDDTFAL